MNAARTLIDAIQSCSTCNLRRAIAQFKNQVNDELPGLGVTALHVAAKAYSTHTHDQALSSIFNQMVRMLLDAGASPCIEAGTTYKARVLGTAKALGVNRLGLTVAEVCDGKMPPALKAWFETQSTEVEGPVSKSQIVDSAEVIRRRLKARARRARNKELKLLGIGGSVAVHKTSGKVRDMDKQQEERCNFVRRTRAEKPKKLWVSP